MPARVVPRSLVVALVVCVLGCTGSYTVTRQLRGSHTQKLYYVYPPGTDPARRLRVVTPLAAKPSEACKAKIATSTSFTMRFRAGAFRPPAVVVEDKGALPKSRSDFHDERDALITDAGNCLTPIEADTVAARLWARMPKSFVDDLYDRYRYDTLNKSIDLQAGMRLRFEWETFFDSREDVLRSYIGAGTSYVTVARRPHDVVDGVTTESGLLTFEPFLSWVDVDVPRNNVPRIAGAVDLEGSTFARKFYRLVLPDSFRSSAEAANGFSFRPMLIGANTLAELDSPDLGSCLNIPADPSQPICTPVAGRTLIVPEIPVRTRDGDTYVGVGTTLRNVLDRSARIWTPQSLPPLRRYFNGCLTTVVFAEADEDALDLPLVKGDRISW